MRSDCAVHVHKNPLTSITSLQFGFKGVVGGLTHLIVQPVATGVSAVVGVLTSVSVLSADGCAIG